MIDLLILLIYLSVLCVKLPTFLGILCSIIKLSFYIKLRTFYLIHLPLKTTQLPHGLINVYKS